MWVEGKEGRKGGKGMIRDGQMSKPGVGMDIRELEKSKWGRLLLFCSCDTVNALYLEIQYIVFKQVAIQI